VTLDSGEMSQIAIAGNGSARVLRAAPRTTFANGGGTAERGLWVINPDGTGRTQLVGPTQVATLLGVTAATSSRSTPTSA